MYIYIYVIYMYIYKYVYILYICIYIIYNVCVCVCMNKSTMIYKISALSKFTINFHNIFNFFVFNRINLELPEDF